MLSIGQFSKTCLASIKTLRHYDKIGLIHPSYTDPFTGYRYYDAAQIPQMLLIGQLKRYGFSLAEIKKMLSLQNRGALTHMLEQQKQRLETQMLDISQIAGELALHLRDYERTGNLMSYQDQYQIHVEQTQDQPVLSTRQNMSLEEFGKYYGTLYERVEKEHIPVTPMTMAIYHDESFDSQWSDIELALGVADPAQATRVIKGCECAATIHKGAYSGLSNAYGALVQWIGENGYEIAGSPYDIYLKTQFDGLPPQEWETKVVFPIQKKNA